MKGKERIEDNRIETEWDSGKNRVAFSEITRGSHLLAWWKCVNNHSWQAKVYSRVGGNGCPYCSGRLMSFGRNLKTDYPDVARQWHPYRNGSFKLTDVHCGSKEKIWWRCDKGHEWKTSVCVRTRMGCGCPICASWAKVSRLEIRIFSEISSLFDSVEHSQKVGGRECDILFREHGLAVEVDGYYWHRGMENRDIAKNRKLLEEGIRVIRVRQIPLKRLGESDVLVLQSESDKSVVNKVVERISDLIGQKRDEYVTGGEFVNEKVYERMVANMPHIRHEDSFGFLFPEESKQWHSTKNGDLNPFQVRPYSRAFAWWTCKQGHEWKTSIQNRSQGKGCPYCAGQRVCTDNSLLSFPDIASQWNYSMNGEMTPDKVTRYSGRKVWWTCVHGHNWDEVVKNRTKQKTGCPFCSGRRKS